RDRRRGVRDCPTSSTSTSSPPARYRTGAVARHGPNQPPPMRRPGPPWIEPDAYPGGVVVMVYALSDDGPQYVMTAKLRDGGDKASGAFLLASLIGADAPVYLVTYD